MVLITGGTGFIGNRLVHRFSNLGIDVRLLSREKIECHETIVCDLQAGLIPHEALRGVHTVFHLAAFSGDLRNVSDIENLYQTLNVDATIRLAEAAVDSGAKRFVYVSSVRAGGRPIKGRCMAESYSGDPEAVYGQTKREAEIKLLDMSDRTGLKVSIIRPALVYGIGVRGNLKRFISAVVDDSLPMMVETKNHLSMIHVEDLISVLLFVAEKECSYGEIYIATDGVDYTTRKIYNAIRKVLDRRSVKMAMPEFIFYGRALLGDLTGGKLAFDSYDYGKLFGDEWYSSSKLNSIGFVPEYNLYETLPEIISPLLQTSVLHQ